ncbi:hypothetical protein CKO42_20985 [Lamprobacter modestohalophilus]|uniref:DUF1441 family protein n=1 Tax=Lamprobacter modestohalophilus TaxID=1064514 RepID=A0A9X0WCG0_9GAMM|nr:DUF1441 family protein [Lamprobacter modestohalophilus]MBK1620856.1 hypothetical protein [Lamprobacter modestohalophilus]
MKQADIARHLDLSVRALRERYAAGQIDKTADLDAQRVQYIRLLRETAANRAPNGPLDPQQEKARLDQLRADEVEIRLAEKRKELVPIEDYERHMAGAFKVVATTLESLPDRLERDVGLSPEAVTACYRAVDGLRNDLASRLQRANAHPAS